MCAAFYGKLASKELQCWPVLRLWEAVQETPQICSHRLTVSLPRLMDPPRQVLGLGRGWGGQEPWWMFISLVGLLHRPLALGPGILDP